MTEKQHPNEKVHSMIRFLAVFIQLWRHRTYLIIPTLLFPAIVAAISFSYTPVFIAETTLGVDPQNATSALLKRLDTSEAKEILKRRLSDEFLLEDALKETGTTLSFDTMDHHTRDITINRIKQNLLLTLPQKNTIHLQYKDPNEEHAVLFLEYVSQYFMDELLAPERLDIEESLLSLSKQFQYYSTQQKRHEMTLEKMKTQDLALLEEKEKEEILRDIVAAEFNVQKATAQKNLAQKGYEALLEKAQSLSTRGNINHKNGLIHYIDLPTLTDTKHTVDDHIALIQCAAVLGILFGVFLIIINFLCKRTFTSETEIIKETGVKVIGHVPHLGDIHTDEGRLFTHPINLTF